MLLKLPMARDVMFVSFLMCVDMAGRLPGNFADIWPQMQMSLGGDGLAKICNFVVTKANGDSKVNRAKLKALPDQEFYKELVYSPLKWRVIHAGRENLDLIQEVLMPTTTTDVGIGGAAVDPDAESLDTKQKIAKEYEEQVKALEARAKQLEDPTRLAETMKEMRDQIDNAYETLASLGNCKDKEKRELKAYIDRKKKELADIEERHRRGLSSEKQVQAELKQWNEALQKKTAEIGKMHGLGAFFRSLVGGVVDAGLAVGETLMPPSRPGR